MAYGIELYRANASKMADGASQAGIFIEVLVIDANSTTGNKIYTQVPAGSLYCVNVDSGAHDFTIDSSTGYARVNWVRRGNAATTRLMVFARKVNTSETYGMLIANDAGDLLADINYPVPQYVGSVQPGATADTTYVTPGGLQGNGHTAAAVNYRPGTDRIVLVNIPDSGTADIWYSCDSFISANNTTGFTLGVTVFAPAGVSYQVPSLHIFSLNGPIASSSTYGIQLENASAAVVYDSGAENMYAKDSVIVNYPTDPTATVSYTLSLPTYAGVILPYFYRVEQTPPYQNSYLSAVKRVGNQLTFKTMYVQHKDLASTAFGGYQYGASSNSLCMVVDLAQLGQGSVAGTPAASVQTAPAFTTQPSPTSVTAGSTASFTVAASGNPAPTYQWQVNNVDIAGATSATYSFTTAAGDNGKVYRCFALNTTNGVQNSTASNGATLTVSTGGGGVAPTITSSPSNQSVTTGGSASFSCSASGTATLAYTWYKGTTSVGTGSTLTISPVASGDAGTYYCHVTNSYGYADSTSATLTVTASGAAPTITSNPSNQTVASGASTSFSVSATGTATLTYAWYKSGSSTVLGTSSSYSFTASSGTAGTYYCVVTNSYGSATSSTATLTVSSAAPIITVQPTDQTAATNATATFSCAATGAGALTYTWQGPIGVVGTNSPSLTVTATSTTIGSYYCAVSNSGGAINTSSATLTIVDTTPVISVQPTNTTTTQGAATSMTCTGSPVTSYEWYRGVGYVSGGGTISPDVSTIGSFSYQCYVRNNTAVTLSSYATLTVNAPPATTYPSYNAISDSVYGYAPSVATFGIFANGSTSGSNWANGTGDGSLYEAYAAGSFVTDPSSASVGVWINLSSNPTWRLAKPAAGGIRNATLSFTVRLVGGSTVTSGSVAFQSDWS